MERLSKTRRRVPRVSREHIFAALTFIDGLGYHNCALFESRDSAVEHVGLETKRLLSDMVHQSAPYSVCFVASVEGSVIPLTDLHAALFEIDGEKIVRLFRSERGRAAWLAADTLRCSVGGAVRLE